MRSVLLSDLIYESRSGYWGSEAGLSEIDACVIRNGDIQEDGIRWSKLPERSVTIDEFRRAIVRSGDLLITTSGNCGYVAYICGEPKEATIASNFVRILRFTPELVVPKFMYHLTRTAHFRDLLAPFIRGTTLKNLALATAADRVRIPLPDLQDQLRITQVLDNVEVLRAKRRQAITKIDCLLQATFLDMFGDPKTNSHGFPPCELSEFYLNPEEGTRCGPFGSALKKSEVKESGVPLWNMDNISNAGEMQLPFRAWVSEQKARELAAYRVLDGDILISRAGTVGKMCVARTGLKVSLITTNLIRLRLGPKLIPEFFVALMTQCKGRVGRLKTGPDGAFTHMSTGVLDALSFPYPPIKQQRNWVIRSAAIKKHQEQLQTHFELMNRQVESMIKRVFAGTP